MVAEAMQVDKVAQRMVHVRWTKNTESHKHHIWWIEEEEIMFLDVEATTINVEKKTKQNSREY